MSEVTAIIPNWNGEQLLSIVLKQLARQSCPLLDTVVVDNGSADSSKQVAERAGARVLALDRNYGFARAVNEGVAASTTEFVAVLNNDVELDERWLESLLRALEEDTEAWFATGKTLQAGDPGRIDGTFDLLCRGACAWRAGHGVADSQWWSNPKRIDSAPFTALVLRRELFQRAGMLEESFESYLEDVEFGLRCARLGLRGRYVPDAVAVHRGSATLGRWHPDTVRRLSRNQVWMIARHFPGDWALRHGWNVLVAQMLWGFLSARHRAGAAWVQGKWEGIAGFARQRESYSEGLGDVGPILYRQEREIAALHEGDAFWRWYFRLT